MSQNWKWHKRITITLLFFLCNHLLLFLTANQCRALATMTVTAEGVAAVINNSQAAAREKAIDDGLRRCVEQAAGSIVTTETFSSGYRVLQDQVLTNASGYIRRYKIISERTEAQLYRVKIQAEVGKTNLMTDLKALGLLQILAGKPKIMFVIDEKVAGLFGTTAWETIGQTESTLSEEFINLGFTVVDPQIVKANITKQKALDLIAGNDQAAAAAGLQVGAQIVIVGKALSKNAGGKIFNSQLQSLQAVIQARVVRTDNAQVIGARSSRTSKAHLDEAQGGTIALESAAHQLATLLAQDITTKWRGETYGRNREISMHLSGLVSYRHLSFIRNFLVKEIEGVKAVHQRSFLAGVAELSLDYSGKSSHIADRLANHKFRGFRLEPVQVTLNKLVLNVILDH